MRILAVIPARGGSKGITDKNIRPLNGKPLIMHAISAATEASKITTVIVTTDSEKIAKIVRPVGITIINRPDELATDSASIVPVLLHALKEMESRGSYFDAVLLLQVTSPLRSGKDIDASITLLEQDEKIDGVISVVEAEDVHPARMYKADQDFHLTPLDPLLETSRRQELPKVYHRNGCIYLVRTEMLKSENSVMAKRKRAYVMDSQWLANIDNERDLLIAELLFREWIKKK